MLTPFTVRVFGQVREADGHPLEVWLQMNDQIMSARAPKTRWKFIDLNAWYHCHVQWSDTTQLLFLLPSTEDYDLFKKLITLDKVGPTKAVQILDKAAPEQIMAAADVKELTKLVGACAEPLFKLLNKDRKTVPKSKANPHRDDVAAALTKLGYNITEARRRVDLVLSGHSDPTSLDSSTLLTQALAN